jgi:hypothetical protein
MNRAYHVVLAALLTFSATSAVLAAPVQVNSVNASSETFYGASSTDLINQGQPTYASSSSTGYTSFNNSTTSALNDGSPGLPSSAGTDLTTVAFDLDGTWTTTFNLNTNPGTGGSALGYAITQIQTTAGWPDERADQTYALSYSTVAAPSTFIPLGTFSLDSRAVANPSSPSTPFNGASEITLTDSTGILATHVAALQFSFSELNGGNSGTVYREIDVLGHAVVPEPSSIVLATLAMVGLALAIKLRRPQITDCI